MEEGDAVDGGRYYTAIEETNLYEWLVGEREKGSKITFEMQI